MLRLCFCLFVLLSASSLVLAQNNSDTEPTPKTTTTVPETTTTTPKTTTTTTTETTTTTTTKQTTTTTTATTAKPDIVPDFPKNVGTWMVNETANPQVACLILNAAFQISVTYESEKSKSEVGTINVPPHATGKGKCNDDNSAELFITWPVVNSSDVNQLNLTFKKDSKVQGKEVFALYEVRLNVTKDFVDEKDNSTSLVLANQTFTDETARFRAPVNKSYTCTKEPSIKFSKVTTVELKVGKLQVEAFRSTPFDKFSAEFECSADDVSAVVPFAVGASLALLVVIVLIAYLIGRRRSRARGYQSV